MTERALRSEEYSFETMADGVTLARARAEGTALSNSGIVDLGGATVLFDTSLTLRTVRELHEAARSLTGRHPTFGANSHWHLDHVLGNQVLADRAIYATRRTIELLLEQRAELEAELTAEKLSAEVRELEEGLRSATTEVGRGAYERAVRINRALLHDVLELRLTPPSTGFEGELRLPGERDARLLTFGSGHTESDAVLLLPKEGVLFAGDLVVGRQHPNVASGDPEHWLVVLDEIERLRPERIATGHGPAGTLETVGEMRDYLTALLELSREGAPEPPIPPRFRSWTHPEQFARNLQALRSRAPGRPAA